MSHTGDEYDELCAALGLTTRSGMPWGELLRRVRALALNDAGDLVRGELPLDRRNVAELLLAAVDEDSRGWVRVSRHALEKLCELALEHLPRERRCAASREHVPAPGERMQICRCARVAGHDGPHEAAYGDEVLAWP